MSDPTGGTFDAAGDFDRLIDEAYFGRRDDWNFPTLRRVDPYASTTMNSGDMAGLLDDIARVVPDANLGPELRGILRLQAMAGTCEQAPDAVMVWMGD